MSNVSSKSKGNTLCFLIIFCKTYAKIPSTNSSFLSFKTQGDQKESHNMEDTAYKTERQVLISSIGISDIISPFSRNFPTMNIPKVTIKAGRTVTQASPIVGKNTNKARRRKTRKEQKDLSHLGTPTVRPGLQMDKNMSEQWASPRKTNHALGGKGQKWKGGWAQETTTSAGTRIIIRTLEGGFGAMLTVEAKVDIGKHAM